MKKKKIIIMKNRILLIGFMVLSFSLTAQQRLTITMKNVMPMTQYNEYVVDHKNYTELYSPMNKQSACVVYLLTKEMVEHPTYKRVNAFKKDPQIKKDYSLPSDYDHSGYDKGHLCPCEDMRWDKDAMLSTFYMSNMSPQLPKFNRGDWKRLEEMTRQFALDNDSVIVIVIPIYNDKPRYIGVDNVSVPSAFCKIIIDVSYPTYKAIAFIMTNDNTVGRDIYKCAMTITSSEKITDYQLFSSEKDLTPYKNFLEKTDVSEWKK